MHTNETKDKFIELRVAGLSLEAIAKQLNVAKTTVLRWQRDHDAEIRSLRAAEIDAMFDKIFVSQEVEAKRLAAVQAKIEATIAQRPFLIGDGFDFIKTSAFLRKEIRELRERTKAAMAAKTPLATAPASQDTASQPQPIEPANPSTAVPE